MGNIVLKSSISKNEAAVIRTMLDAGLISYKHYMTWVDEIIMSNDEPDLWILELAATKNTQAAIKIITTYLNTEPFESVGQSYKVSFIACLWVKYKRREISWATFLFESGNEVDANSERVDCEYFYGMHHDLEDSKYSEVTENKQSAEVFKLFRSDIEESVSIYDEFAPYYSKFRDVYGT